MAATTCDACGATDDALVEVHRLYITPEAWDTEAKTVRVETTEQSVLPVPHPLPARDRGRLSRWARELRQLLDIDHYVAMLVERFGHRFGGDWPIEVDDRTEMAVGVVGLGPDDIDWIDEQTPAAARGLVHPRAVRHSLDDLHRYDDALFTRLAELEADQLVAPGWTCAVDVDENRVVVVLASPTPDPTDHLVDQAPADAVAVMSQHDAGTRVRTLVAPKRHERSVERGRWARP